MKRIFRKIFFITLFLKQNKHHRYGVLFHTLAVCIHLLKFKRYNMLLAGLLHDIGKPIIAFQEEKDIIDKEYSFHNHEEISYHIIKNWYISDYTKQLVRYHYLIRGIQLAKKKGLMNKAKRLEKIFSKLDSQFIKDLEFFMICDDLGKKSF